MWKFPAFTGVENQQIILMLGLLEMISIIFSEPFCITPNVPVWRHHVEIDVMKTSPSWIASNDTLAPDDLYETATSGERKRFTIRASPSVTDDKNPAIHSSSMESFVNLLRFCEDSLRPYRICPHFFCTYRKSMTIIEHLDRLRSQHFGKSLINFFQSLLGWVFLMDLLACCM